MTHLHIQSESAIALALLKETASEKGSKSMSLDLKTFEVFGSRIGINEKRLSRINSGFYDKADDVHDIVSRSFLSQDLKEVYLKNFSERMNTVFK